MKTFRAAVEAGDLAGMIATLAPDVVFNSPVAFKPFVGRETVGKVLEAVLNTFEDFHYTDELDDGDVHALIFRARVGDRQVEGIDILRVNEAGEIADFTVMVRPASGLMALGEAMGPKVAGLK